MTKLGHRKTRDPNLGPIRVIESDNIRYTILPSADVLLDPEMVKEIVATREEVLRTNERQTKTPKLGRLKG